MLFVPVELSLGRPTTRRSVLWPILASGLMMGVLGAGAAISIDEFIRKEKAASLDTALPWVAMLVLWAAWSIAFYRTGRGAAAMDVVTQQCRYLLKGSIPGTTRRGAHPHRSPRAGLLLRGSFDFSRDRLWRRGDALFLWAGSVFSFCRALETASPPA
jgi:hypothetical protein